MRKNLQLTKKLFEILVFNMSFSQHHAVLGETFTQPLKTAAAIKLINYAQKIFVLCTKIITFKTISQL